MKIWQAYLDGWRVLARLLAFSFCLCLFGLPFFLAVVLAFRLDHLSVSTALVSFGVLFCLPVATYLASWYSGDFRRRSAEEIEEEALASDEESEY